MGNYKKNKIFRHRFTFLRQRLGGQKLIEEILTEQINVAIEATNLANQVCSQDTPAPDARISMRKIEHEGDSARADLVKRIDLVLTVPLEREDLFRASRYIDDVTDTMRDLVREIALWEVLTGRWSHNILQPATDALKELRRAINTNDSAKGRKHCLRARRHSAKLRRMYQNGLSQVFSRPLSIDTLKEKEVLRRVDSIGLHLTEAADALLDGMIKRYF